MKKYKITNRTNLSCEQVGWLIDLYTSRKIIDTFYIGKEDRITIEFNRKLYCLTFKYGMRHIAITVNEKMIENDRKSV